MLFNCSFFFNVQLAMYTKSLLLLLLILNIYIALLFIAKTKKMNGKI